MDNVAKLVENYRREGKKTTAFFNQLRPEVWDKILYSDGDEWCVKDVLAHIVDTESAHLLLVDHIARGGKGVSKSFDMDEFNATGVAKKIDASPQELIEEFSAHRQKMITFISGLSEDDLKIVGRDPFMGEVTLRDMMRMFYLHVNLHIRDIRKVLG